MANEYTKEKQEPPVPPVQPKPAEPKWYEVRLSPAFKKPLSKGELAKSGVIYKRGGVDFTIERDFVIVTEAELIKFYRPVPLRYATDPVRKELDSNLIKREITKAEAEARS